MVSYDCGSNYGPDLSAENADALKDRMGELDNLGLRWYVDGDDAIICKRHKDILDFMVALAGEEKP